MKTKPRGRPPKRDAERKDVDLRIPVTAEQKALIAEAVRLESVDMASWARPVLLQAAQDVLDRHSAEQRTGKR
ncbi:MAG: hypothetical protein KGL39_12680 [Patescibacteria group bacterium]|nr:hypothetical protein [Patescibacteria group bacterium]